MARLLSLLALPLVLVAAAPAARDADAKPTPEQALAEGGLQKIFLMCVVLYGCIGLAWGAKWLTGRGEGTLKLALLMVSWASMSVGIHVLNKSLAVIIQAPALIAAAQMVVAVAFFAPKGLGQLWNAPKDQVLRWMIVPFFFAAALSAAFYAYERITLTTLVVVRNLAPLIALPMEALVMPPEKRPTVSWQSMFAIVLMMAGALLYIHGSRDMVSLAGIGFAGLSMVLSILDKLLRRRLLTTECKDLPTGVCTLITNLFGLIPTMILALSTNQINEVHEPAHAAAWRDPRVIVLLLLSGLVGSSIGYLGLECQRAISVTSFFVMQNVSEVFVVAASVLLLAAPISGPLSAGGLVLSFCGGILYSPANKNKDEKGSPDSDSDSDTDELGEEEVETSTDETADEEQGGGGGGAAGAGKGKEEAVDTTQSA